MNFREKDIILLFGAGASADAEIPTSVEMVENIEQKVQKEKVWNEYEEVFNYMKSAIHYADGIKGVFNESINIERLVNTLSELEKKEEHTIYPFIGNWNMKLLELAGQDFEKIRKFKTLIIDQLKDWVTMDDYNKGKYYCGVARFQKEYNFSLRVFTLNYDLCLEKNCSNVQIERGFDERSRTWDWRRFEVNENEPVDIFLYKLHGSIDWKRDNSGNLTFSDDVKRDDTPDLIFGTNYKLQYVDPYLFFVYELRKYSLEAKLIVTIGYGFGDEHINGIIGQAAKSNDGLRLVCVGKGLNREMVKGALKISGDQTEGDNRIETVEKAAREYLQEGLTIEKVSAFFPEERNEIDAF